jgi:hypothetical protein
MFCSMRVHACHHLECLVVLTHDCLPSIGQHSRTLLDKDVSGRRIVQLRAAFSRVIQWNGDRRWQWAQAAELYRFSSCMLLIRLYVVVVRVDLSTYVQLPILVGGCLGWWVL